MFKGTTINSGGGHNEYYGKDNVLNAINLATEDGFEAPNVDEMHLPPFFTVGSFEFSKQTLLVVLSVVIIAGLFGWLSRKKAMVPSKAQFIGESCYLFVRNSIAKDTIGARDFKVYVPLLFSLFFFVLINNIYGAIPLLQLPSFSHPGAAYSLAIIAYFAWIAAGVHRQGAGKFLKLMTVPSGIPKFLLVLVTPIEIISNFLIRPMTHSLRLFATMFAGHLIFMVAGAGISYLSAQDAVGLKLTSLAVIAGGIGMYLLEALMMVLQAFIFTLLTAVYLQSAIADEH